jgi:hypothetical protein
LLLLELVTGCWQGFEFEYISGVGSTDDIDSNDGGLNWRQLVGGACGKGERGLRAMQWRR